MNKNEEIIDIVNEANEIISTSDVETAHKKKLLHRVIAVFLFNHKGDMYVQTGNKYNRIDVAVGGHVKSGETYEEAAQREMLEEINLSVPLSHQVTFLPEHTKMGHYWSIYIATTPKGWNFTPTEEVASLEAYSVKEINEMTTVNPEAFTYGFLNSYAKLKDILKI